MRSSPSFLLAAVSLLFLSASVQGQKNADYTIIQKYIGCFKSKGNLELAQKDDGQSQGLCRDKCAAEKKRYAGTTNVVYCYCGDKLPPESDLVSNDKCDQPCKGYPFEPCGSRSNHYTIFLVDTSQSDPRLYDGSGKEDNPNETIKESSTQVIATITNGQTIIVTQTSTEKPKENKGGINKAGAAAGAVVGVLVAIAIGVGAFIFIRKQRRKKVEEEYRRQAAVREFHQKPMPDLRLDPVMLQRRASDGSIADNQDYSRRILKVTNPDDR